MKDRLGPFAASKGNEMRALLSNIEHTDSSADVGKCLEGSKFAREFPIYSIGICRLDDVPIKQTIFSAEIGKTGLSGDDFPDAWRWIVCREAEALMRPFDFLSHEFITADSGIFAPVRQIAEPMGFKQVMFIPLQIKNTMTITIVHFPNGDFDQQAKAILSEIYQIIFAIFERFPGLIKWPDECRLTRREKEILELTAGGLTEAVISLKLGISAHTVRNHMQSCKRKLDARSKAHAVAIAIRDREIAPDFQK